jgi:hypothetical protein
MTAPKPPTITLAERQTTVYERFAYDVDYAPFPVPVDGVHFLPVKVAVTFKGGTLWAVHVSGPRVGDMADVITRHLSVYVESGEARNLAAHRLSWLASLLTLPKPLQPKEK